MNNPSENDRGEAPRNSDPIGKTYLDLKYINKGQLDSALHYQRRKGGRIGWILGILGFINRVQLFEGIASHFRLAFTYDFRFLRENIDPNLAKTVTNDDVVNYKAIPFSMAGDNLTVITSEPKNQRTLDFLRQKLGPKTVTEVVVTDLDLMKLSEQVNRESLIEKATRELINRQLDECAFTLFTKRQLVAFILFIAFLVGWGFINHPTLIISAIFAVQVLYLGSFLYKLFLFLVGLVSRSKNDSLEDIKELNDDELPVYTILVPAYRESRVIGSLVKSLKQLDYPEHKLDIILILEEDDNDTIRTIKLEKPPITWRFLVLPNNNPKTKPKALNYGLQFARGEYLTIYDAEDLPHPDQLKKAIKAFQRHPDYVCFQAALSFYNENENFLTKMFTAEYSGWFDCILQGLSERKLPIPLGGTSNHFNVLKLKEIGAWDPYNVTEDADLGIRAAIKGYKVGVINSTTWEEANSRINNWLRQRSRWVKGFMVTTIVHSRHPLRIIKSVGFKQWLAYNLLIGGTVATFLLNPIMWGMFAYSFFGPIDDTINPPTLFYISAFNLIVGNGLAIILIALGALPRKKYHLVPYALLAPLYWALQSVAAYKALWQLIVKPYYWEKTEHGLSLYYPNMPLERVHSITEIGSVGKVQIKSGLPGQTNLIDTAVTGVIIVSIYFFLLLVFVAMSFA